MLTSDPRGTPLEVIELDKTVATLEAEITRLKLRRSRILADRALIWRLPSEILRRIFELGTHEYNHLPQTLSLVSRSWRTLALDTPVLWTYITLDRTFGHGMSDQFLRKAKAYLQRSQACKFLVDIDCRYVDSIEDLLDMLFLLEPHLHRCFSFQAFFMDWEEGIILVRDHIRGLGPSLESFCVRIDPDDGDPVTSPLLSAPCPRLQTVVLERAPLKTIGETYAGFSHLTTLHLVRDQRYVSHASARISISLTDLLARLAALPMLTELCIQSTSIRFDDEHMLLASPALTTVPSLKYLICNLIDSTTLSLFLESTFFPNLERLRVQMCDTIDDIGVQWLQHVTSISPPRLPSLRYLDLRACNVDGAALFPFVRALRHLPDLTALALSSPPSGCIGIKLFDVLTLGRTTTEKIIPKLRALCLQNCRDVTGPELIRLVHSRYGSNDAGTIEYLKLAQCYTLDLTALKRLTALVSVVRVM